MVGAYFQVKIYWLKASVISSGYDLGVTDEPRVTLTQQVDSFDYPDTNCRDQEVADNQGSFKKISLKGKVFFTTWDAALLWKENMQALFCGSYYTQSLNIYLAVYIQDFFGSGSHLWFERDGAPVLENSGSSWGNNLVSSRPAQNSASNQPICITPTSWDAQIMPGDQPCITWTLECVQRIES
jgi:hypothetical protein